jgi:hypothetical protein
MNAYAETSPTSSFLSVSQGAIPGGAVIDGVKTGGGTENAPMLGVKP